ncbi:MAG: bifunctional 4-hydroxy-2-oxoglutarate aldolase/2-dehydro-3-deoxy-phosphogluconate aldolase [Clostridiales Family XIII bacterium]|jgi:2-dehydro-3-deoxyphosphogluconate aldolase/(4S)-4-hydroxy-2-oxoglutarate aldolase|nr:bifunctional 4-hydroxy-2-oxoglutarate aldolase/2-dehydro-3-deoxy-phosphogluconate aldolase [Clostridiales Family XIII bacterium]
MNDKERLESIGLVPVVVIDDAADSVETANALTAGGVRIMEITLRTAAGLDAIAEVAGKAPEMLVGAGTVLSLDSAKDAVRRGAKFVVSPGFDAEIVSWCLEQGVAVYPGCVTPTEITAALKLGLDVVKFFPANVYGGVKAIKALSGPFPNVRFIPTGGVGLDNLSDFVLPQIIAIGGGWLCARNDIREKNFAHITEVSKRSADIVRAARSASS